MRHQIQSKSKMRNILCLVLFLSISLPGFSQDIISLKKGKRIEAFVIEITPAVVRYKLSNKPDAKVYFAYKEDVSGILFQNGKVEKFEDLTNQKDKDEYSSEDIVQQSRNMLDKSKNLETGNYIDAIYLKNGSIIRGVIIEQVPNVSYKIETADNSIFVFQIEEVNKITKELKKVRATSVSDEREPLSRKKSGLQRGYKCIIEQGFAAGVIGDYALDRFNFYVINGGQLNPYFSIGGGIGVNYYTSSEEAIVPVFADFRFNFMNNRISPFFSFDLGYSFSGDGFDGLGMFLSPTAGITFKTSRKFAIHIGTGFDAQHWDVQYKDGYYNYSYKIDEWLTALTFKLGISF